MPEADGRPLRDALPPDGSLERWALDYVLSTRLEHKLRPGPAPAPDEPWRVDVSALRPGRPPELVVRAKARKQRGFEQPHGRARLLHAFMHHELQAAELFAWAILAFPEAPRDVKRGLARIVDDEARHARLYLEQVERLGHSASSFPVRDWFWDRVPRCGSLRSFSAVMGLGFEAANLDHAARFVALFERVGDHEAARVQREVGRDEIAHVRFGADVFRGADPTLDFDAFRRALPEPLSPMLMRGPELDLGARASAGLDDAFLTALRDYPPAR